MDYPRAAVGHMPFPGHRTQAEIAHAERVKEARRAGFQEGVAIITAPSGSNLHSAKRPARNQRLVEQSSRLVGHWRKIGAER